MDNGLINKIIKIKTSEALKDAYLLCCEQEEEGSYYVDNEKIYNEDNFNLAHENVYKIERYARKLLVEEGDYSAEWVYNQSLLFQARYDFDCFMRYMEKERPIKSKFYEPRRKQLLPCVRALEDLANDKLDILAISLPPGVGKTTLAEFYLVWLGGKQPNSPILGGSHSNSFLRGVYDEIIRMISSSEYCYKDVFPNIKIVGQNAKEMRFDLDKRKRFETFQFSSIGSGNAGKVRAVNLLYCDDLVPDIETALSTSRMDKLYQQYYTDLRQRKTSGCKELHIATRWSVRDVIGRLQSHFEDNERARFISIPALNEKDESNFEYPYVEATFSTKFYHEQRDIMDNPSWKALYMNEPIEREGLLYNIDELRRYHSLPNREPDGIFAVCDTKTTGTDYCVMPIAYKYGEDMYIEDCVCNNGAIDLIEGILAKKIIEHNIQMVQFESNSAGGKIADDVNKAIKERGSTCSISKKWTQANKETKIMVNAGWVVKKCLFKDDIVGEKQREYRDMLSLLCSYTLSGKNAYDDVPDAFAQLSEYMQSFVGHKATVMKRWF